MADHPKIDRIVDIASVALISAAAVLSALCSYQATRWSGDQARLYNVSDVLRTQSAEATNRALAMTAINVNLFLNYANAYEANDVRRMRFLYDRMPFSMRKALDEWTATKPLHNPKAPSSPFVMREYSDAMHAEAREIGARASASFHDAQLANEHADNFMLLTVVFAAVSFLGGMSTKMRFPRHAIVIAVGSAALLFGIVRLAFMQFL